MQNIKIFITDVDGVMTDGKIHYSSDGVITRSYHMHDGIFPYLNEQGITTAFCTSESDGSIEKRAKKLKISHLIMGSKNKLEDISNLLGKLGLSWEEAAYVGDDLGDILVLKKVGLPCAVNNAREEVKEIVVKQAGGYVTKANGGEGAIREIYDKFFRK